MSHDRLSRLASLGDEPGIREALKRSRQRVGEEPSIKVLIHGAMLSSHSLEAVRVKRRKEMRSYTRRAVKRRLRGGPISPINHRPCPNLEGWAKRSKRRTGYREITRRCAVIADVILVEPVFAPRMFVRTAVEVDHWLPDRLYALEAIEHALRKGMDLSHWFEWMKRISDADGEGGREGFWMREEDTLSETLSARIDTMQRQITYFNTQANQRTNSSYIDFMTSINLVLDAIAISRLLLER